MKLAPNLPCTNYNLSSDKYDKKITQNGMNIKFSKSAIIYKKYNHKRILWIHKPKIEIVN